MSQASSVSRAAGPCRPTSGGAATVVLAVGLAVAPAAPAALAAQQDMQDVDVTATHVAGNVYVLEGRGGNIGVTVGEDGVLMVDDQFAPLAPEIRATIDSLGGESLEFVLNTHWHGDHTGGNQVFGRHAPIVAHHNVRERLSRTQVIRGDTIPASPDEALPVVTFGRSVTIHFNGEPIRVEHYPRGHTDGDAIVYFTGSDVVHMGDHMFAGRFPFVDLGSGGSVQGYMENVGAVLDTVPSDAAVIPGHGPLTDVEGLREYHRMLIETTRIVRDRLERGMSLEEAKSAGLPAEWASWGEGFISTEQWLETVYRSFRQEASARGPGPDAERGSGSTVAADRHAHGSAGPTHAHPTCGERSAADPQHGCAADPGGH